MQIFPDKIFSDISLTFSKMLDISLTAVKFPDISRFSRQVVALFFIIWTHCDCLGVTINTEWQASYLSNATCVTPQVKGKRTYIAVHKKGGSKHFAVTFVNVQWQ